MKHPSLWLVVLVCALSACTGDGQPRRSAPNTASPQASASVTPTTQPSPSPTVASGCANERAATRPERLQRGSLTGDLDGDGSDEVVRIAIDESGAPGCRAFVVMRSSTLDEVTAIKTADDLPVSPDLGFPALDSIRPIGFGPGDELVLVLWSGASTQFFGIATVVDGELVQVTIDEDRYRDMFPYGGSVTHLEASDCAREVDLAGVQTIVISGAAGEGRRYRIERRFFEITDGPELRSVPDATERRIVSFEELVSYPEFGEAPFAHCG